MNRITAYLKTKPGPYLITSEHSGTPEASYTYTERSVPPIPKVLVDKAKGKEVTYVYTERTKSGEIARMAMVRIPDTPEIRLLMATWFRNGITRRDPSRQNRTVSKSVALPPMAYLQSDVTCELGPDEIDPRCVDNEQYYDPDLGMYVLCEIIVCDDEEFEGDGGGGSPNPPNYTCTIGCEPGWGEPPTGGGPGSGINLPTNPSNNDIFWVIDPNTGEMYDLTFLSDWMSWLTPELRTALLSTLLYVNIAPEGALPNISGDARILSTVWSAAIFADPATPVGEIGAALLTASIGAVYVYWASSFLMNYGANMVNRRQMCLEKYLVCIDIYGNNPYDYVSCDTCQQNCITNGAWPDYMCNLSN